MAQRLEDLPPDLQEEIKRANALTSLNPVFDPAARATEYPLVQSFRSPAEQAAGRPPYETAEYAENIEPEEQPPAPAPQSLTYLPAPGQAGAPGAVPGQGPGGQMPGLPGMGGINRALGDIRKTAQQAQAAGEKYETTMADVYAKRRTALEEAQAIGEWEAEKKAANLERQAEIAGLAEQRRQALAQRQQIAVDDQMQKIREVQDDLRTSKIDPQRMFKTAAGKPDTGKRILAAIAIGLGQYSATHLRKENTALRLINNAIDRDIDAQKANLANKQAGLAAESSILGMMRQKFADEKDAEAATRIHLMELAKMDLESVLGQSASKQAALRGQDAIAQLDQQQAAEAYKIQENTRARELQAHQLALSGETTKAQLGMTRAAMAGKLVSGAGKQLPASAVAKTADFRGARNNVDLLEREWRDKTGWASIITQYIPGTSTKKYVDAQKAAAQLIGKKLEGRMTDEDYERILGMMPEPGDSRGRAENKFRLLREYIDNMEQGAMSAYQGAGFATQGMERPGGTGTIAGGQYKD